MDHSNVVIMFIQIFIDIFATLSHKFEWRCVVVIEAKFHHVSVKPVRAVVARRFGASTNGRREKEVSKDNLGL